MIISRLEGTNILKYRHLALTLPEDGLIAISGPNESGKSSIGEAVCFALFGRTFSIGPDELEKVVRWGEGHCNVVLDFRVGDDDYRLSRQLDREGNHGAKLHRVGEDKPLARGVPQVAERLTELVGFEYEQFVESFYLAQREITTPHPHSRAVKIMAGVAPLEQVADEIHDEIREFEEQREEVQTEIESTRQEIDELDLEEGRLQRLEKEREETQDEADLVAGLREEIIERLGVYETNKQEILRAESARSRASLLRFLFFLLALAAGAVWWLLGKGAGMPLAAQLRGLLDQYVPQWQAVPNQWILWGAIAFAVLFLLSWVRVAAKSGRIRALRAESGRLVETLQRAREIDVAFEAEQPLLPSLQAQEGASVCELPEEGDETEVVDEPSHAPEVEASPRRPDAGTLELLVDPMSNGEATLRQVHDYVEPELEWLGWVQEQLQAGVGDLDQAIEEERERLRQAERLNQVIEGLREKREEIESRIGLRRTALELLAGAIDHLSNNFNRDIKDLVARLLPRFTEGRYEHLKVDEDLKVQVFSAEKRDFMALDEVSSGTQRQIMLALRLALSQKLLARKVKGKQFAFLDEPFAFFDDERTRNALAALAELGDDISQVWIVAQSFPEDAGVRFDVHIQCERGQDELAVGVSQDA
ncbi:MAG: ATPase [Gammaproteobacteria bacterium]|nr:MAG: ATPase [Gammaproteobacteria bacterium]